MEENSVNTVSAPTQATQTKPGGQKGNKNARSHGLYSMKRAVNELGLKGIDGRSSVGRALSKWRSDLIRDMGGEESISTQQEAMVDLAVKSKLMLDSIDAWLLQQQSLVNKRKKSLLPVVRERTQLADALARYLLHLGLEKRTRELSLTELLAQEDGEQQEEPEEIS